MDYYQLRQQTLNSPALKLLKSQNAALIISFLYQQFRADHQPTVDYVHLRDALNKMLDDINDYEPESFKSSADTYLRQWADPEHNWIRITSSSDGDTVSLTSSTQRVIGWIQDLEQRNVVATGSRFQLVLNQMERLLTQSTEDVETRLQQLRDEKARIEAEIERIEQTGVIKTSTPNEIREQFSLTTEIASQLLQDFSAVEEAFQETAKDVHQRQLEPDVRKGQVVQNVIDADLLLRESDIGQSFYAFWQYLQTPGKQDQLNEQLEQLYQLDALRGQSTTNVLLRDLVRHLVRAGLKVEHSNQRLAQQLRRMLDEANRAESRRIRELSRDIQSYMRNPRLTIKPDETLMKIETVPQPQLVLERTLYEPEISVIYEDMPEEQHNNTDADFDDLLDYFYVDLRQLQENIDAMLEERQSVTLTEVIEHYPLTRGLSEIIGYLELAGDDDRYSIQDMQLIEVLSQAAQSEAYLLRLRVPQIIFRRQAETTIEKETH